MNYSVIRPAIQTGDIVLFSGNGGISSLIQLYSGSRWSHVGMAIGSKELDMVLLMESTTLSTIPDLESGALRQGVQLVPLSQRVATYDGDVAVRHINKPLRQRELAALADFRSEMKGKPYEQDNMQLARAAMDTFSFENKPDLSSVFCSELVSEFFMRIGLLTRGLPANEYTPADFSDGARLVMGSHGPEMSIER